MWPYSITLAVLVLAVHCCHGLQETATPMATVYPAMPRPTRPTYDAVNLGYDSLKNDVGQAREMKKAIVPLMMGIILKVGSLVPMKLMIMTFFTIIALLASKFALLLTTVTGIFQHKSHNQQRLATADGGPLSIIDSSPYSAHQSAGSINNQMSVASSLYNQFANTGDGASGFESQQSSFVTGAGASPGAPTNVPMVPNQRRRKIHVYH